MKISEFIQKYDTQNQYQVLKETYKQIEFTIQNSYPDFGFNIDQIDKIIISGLGGSAISGDLLKNFLKEELSVPVIVNRNYFLPSFADEKTLLIASSYSGNTEETLSSFSEAVKKGCKVICISTGGKLEKLAQEHSAAFIRLQKGFQPRYALGLSFFTLLKVFEKLKLIGNQKEVTENIISLWKRRAAEYSTEDNLAVSIAQQLVGFIPVIYSASDYSNAVGYRLKSQLNENSKLHAFHHEFPEMNHNEIIGWETHQQKNLHTKVIYILDETYHPQIKKRFQIVSEFIKKSDTEIISLKSQEKDFKVRIMDLIFLADWISFYLGVFRGFDPSEIEYINLLKERLS
ncbi:MAG: bifunctional phosphoglucose/phosphomannose isomerase [Ignavibacterium album]|uniref:bifunctional phosphoglucose/phosphomannose isomerase n=1 Tax=Ignavibacterium album TaxID=591197 RepID=UPI0026E98E7A|nr:bifunctional phosphoglucose/phosphomannose isomerase [Ignavibacterium album]MBI5661041.1 bifunctional phosphoglucose/phosphomannose isomerase [Ignavibacterium album]